MTPPGMNPDERDRLARLEARFDSMENWVKSMDGKLDTLVQAASWGRGAGWMVIKVGMGLGVIGAGCAWVWDRLPRLH